MELAFGVVQRLWTRRRSAKGSYYEEYFIVADIDVELVSRKRKEMPWLRDENVDLTLNELMRIRQRSA